MVILMICLCTMMLIVIFVVAHIWLEQQRRRYVDLLSITESKWACTQIADALEIDSDAGNPAEYVRWALREKLGAAD